MTSDIPSLARRATMQIRSGLEKLRDGDLLGAEVMLRAGMASLASVEALIVAEEAPEKPAKPARLLSLVDAETPEADLPAWMETKHGDQLPRSTAELYPKNWPRCACGDYVLDGHLTCGRVECGTQAEAERRR